MALRGRSAFLSTGNAFGHHFRSAPREPKRSSHAVLHFTKEETEARDRKWQEESYTASKRWCWIQTQASF